MPSGHDHGTGHRALLACGAIGAPLFVVVFLIEGAVPAIRSAGYSPLRHPVSGFAIGEFGWIQTVNFLVIGVLLLAFAVGLRAALRSYGDGIWAPVLIGLIAIGLTGAGLFTADPLNGYPLETPALPDAAARTTHGVLHDAFSALVFLGLPAACCVVGYRFARSGHRSWAAYSVGTAVVFLTGFVLADMGFAQHPTFVPIAGLLQRLTLIAGLAWITALALYLIRRRPELHRPPPQLSQQTAGAVASTSVRAFGAHHTECLERQRASAARLVCLKGKAMMDNKDTGGRQTVPLRRPWDLILVSGFTILAGFAEIVTGFSHKFFGITTSDVALFTIAATGIGLSYLASGMLILTMKKWAAIVAVVLLSIDIAGRILLAATGLYPTDTAKNTFSLIAGTLIVALVALYIGWKWKSFA